MGKLDGFHLSHKTSISDIKRYLFPNRQDHIRTFRRNIKSHYSIDHPCELLRGQRLGIRQFNIIENHRIFLEEIFPLMLISHRQINFDIDDIYIIQNFSRCIQSFH